MKTQPGNGNHCTARSMHPGHSHMVLRRAIPKLRNYRSNIVRVLLFASALFTVCAQNDPFITRPETEVARAAPYRDFVLASTLLRFVPVRDERGMTTGHIAMEVSPAGEPGILVQARRYFQTPTEFFHAISKSEQTVDQIVAPSSHGGGLGDCDASWPDFRDDVLSWGYGLSFLSQSDGPSAGTGHWFASGGFYGGFYELHGRADNVSTFFARVRFCYEDPVAPPWQSEGVNPNIILNYRVGSGSWASVSFDFNPLAGLPVGEEVSFWRHPIFEPLPDVPVNQLDFKLRIYLAALDDRFHIGATWSKPFDTFTPN